MPIFEATDSKKNGDVLAARMQTIKWHNSLMHPGTWRCWLFWWEHSTDSLTMIKLLLLSWGVVHSNLGLAHADSHLLRSQQGFVFLHKLWPPRFWTSCILTSVGGLGSNIRELEQSLLELPNEKMSDTAQVLDPAWIFPLEGRAMGGSWNVSQKGTTLYLEKDGLFS